MLFLYLEDDIEMGSINMVKGDKSDAWLIRRYEAYQFKGPSVSDKFIPVLLSTYYSILKTDLS